MTDRTADKIEQELAGIVEDDFGTRVMAQKLAPRGGDSRPLHTPVYASSPSSPDSVERSLVEIEKLIRKVRELSAEIKGKLG